MATIKEAVIDTNILIALIDERDNWRHRAVALLDALYDEEVIPVFFDCVINESINVLSRRAEERRRSHEFAGMLDDLDKHVPKQRIVWASTEFSTFHDETIVLVRQTNGELNFHDAFIAILCRTFNITYILSFDKDFDRVDWLTRLTDADEVQRAFTSR